MVDIHLDLNSLLDRHDVEAAYIPGFVLVVACFLLFYPRFFTWQSLLQDSLFIVLLIVIAPFICGVVVHTLGSVIEKLFIEKLFNLDLKRIENISRIVGKSKATFLLRKYGIDRSKTKNYFMHVLGKKTRQEEKWELAIRAMKTHLDGTPKERAESYNKRNKLCRGLLTDVILLYIAFGITFGFHTLLTIQCVLIFIILIVVLVKGMLACEKRELQIYYDA